MLALVVGDVGGVRDVGEVVEGGVPAAQVIMMRRMKVTAPVAVRRRRRRGKRHKGRRERIVAMTMVLLQLLL